MTTQTDTESVERQAAWQDDFGDPGVAKFIRALAAERDELKRLNEELDFLLHEGGPDSVAALEAENARIREAGEALVEIVEGVSVVIEHGTWVSTRHDMRLKDTPEWVRFYVAHRRKGRTGDG